MRAGEYSYVVLQTCLENAQNASLFEVVGGSMGEDERYSWRAPPPAHEGAPAFELSTPMLVMPFLFFRAQRRICKSTKPWRDKALADGSLLAYAKLSVQRP